MKLCRFVFDGRIHTGIVDQFGNLRDAGPLPHAFGHGVADADLAPLRSLDALTLAEVPAHISLSRPWGHCSKVIGIGLNYREHARESGMAAPTEPILFLKAPNSLSGPSDPIVMPVGSSQVDWEVELGVVIGRRASNVSPQDALSHVAGYCVFNDVSERAFQFQSAQWDKGKGCDTFGPAGPWLVTADEVVDPQDLRLWLSVNGELMQDGNTSDMIFPVAELIAYCSRYMTLQPGDLIATGTPSGVGMGFKPQRWLKPGDIVELGIEGLGSQRQVVVQTTPPSAESAGPNLT